VFRETAEPSSGQDNPPFSYSLFVRLWVRIRPLEKKLHVFVCQLFAHDSYPELDQKLRELRAIPLMHSIWAARTVLTARELRDALRKTLDDSDRILVVEVSAGWASRRAENDLGELFPPRGGPALALWRQRWGE
jgi:hypothetical protein